MTAFSAFVEYRAVVGHPGYIVGSDGSIRSTRLRHRPLCELATLVDKGGYTYTQISKNSKNIQLYHHRAVCMAFHGQPAEGQETRHLDGNQRNNKADNLCWGTHEENVEDQRKHGNRAWGDKSGVAVLSVETWLEIVKRCHAGERKVDLAKEFGVRKYYISAVMCGKRRPYIRQMLDEEQAA